MSREVSLPWLAGPWVSLDWMLPPAPKAPFFPSPTHQVYLTLPRFKSLFVLWLPGLASEASTSLAGSLGPVYLYNEMIHKSREGIGS